MTTLVLDRLAARDIINERRARGHDRWDEVWDGLYIVMPSPNVEHSRLTGRLVIAIGDVIEWPGLGCVLPGTNVSDRVDDWRKNYRCPDVAVYLKGNPAVEKDSYWLGGPDFAIEIVSPDDRSRQKFDFYAKVGVRELLLIDRDPWSLELYQCLGGNWVLAGCSKLDDPQILSSTTLPLRFRLCPGDPRLTIELTKVDGSRSWID
jgi:Uma2 family endonuclease